MDHPLGYEGQRPSAGGLWGKNAALSPDLCERFQPRCRSIGEALSPPATPH
jgi:hypothetical protein